MTRPPNGNTMVGWDKRRRRKALVREISPNFTNALANYFGNGPSNLDLSRDANRKYVEALEKQIKRIPNPFPILEINFQIQKVCVGRYLT